jgi:hypothetical protein
MQLLQKAYGPDLDARHDKQTVISAGQQATVSLMHSLGIVANPDALSGDNFGATRAKVVDQVVGMAAAKRGYDPTNAGDIAKFKSEEGAVLLGVLGDMPDADLRFALEDSHSSVRLLSNRPGVTLGQIDDAGTLAGMRAYSFTGADGIPHAFNALAGVGAAIAGGIPRGDATADIMARAGGILEGSQCPEYFGEPGLVFSDYAYGFSFQSSFAVANMLEQRLTVIKEDWKLLGLKESDPNSDVQSIAAMGAAETGTWAGTGRFILNNLGLGDRRFYSLVTIGQHPEDWGVSSVEAMQDRLLLVHGEPWHADCAAGLRDSCPDNFAAGHVAEAIQANVTLLTGTAPRLTGANGALGVFFFSADQLVGSAPHSNTTYPNHLYVVLKSDPATPSRGKVLGTVTSRPDLPGFIPGGATQEVDSPHQRELLNAVLGVPKSWPKSGGDIGGRNPAFSESFCMPGVPYELFVPLENELTSDSDQYENSWRHYLTQAQAAAARADDLGQKLIEIGLQKDLRREAAGEEIGKICGDYHALDNVATQDGKIVVKNSAGVGKDGSGGADQTGNTLSPDDAALNDCLDSEKIDIVFLAAEPPDLLNQPNEQAATTWIRDKVLGCSAAGNTNTLCSKDKITHGSLNLVPPPLDPPKSQCDDVASLPSTLQTGFKGSIIQQQTNLPYLSKDNLAVIAENVSMQVSNDGEWSLTVGGAPVMDSHPSKLWPGCRRPGGDCSDSKDVANRFDQSFRGVTAGQALADGEVSSLRWRVQGAMW